MIGKLGHTMAPALSLVNKDESRNGLVAQNVFASSITGVLSIHRIYVGRQPEGGSVVVIAQEPDQQNQAPQKNSSIAPTESSLLQKSVIASSTPRLTKLRDLPDAVLVRANAGETGSNRVVHENIRPMVAMLEKVFSINNPNATENRRTIPLSTAETASSALRREGQFGMNQLPQAPLPVNSTETPFVDAQTCACPNSADDRSPTICALDDGIVAHLGDKQADAPLMPTTSNIVMDKVDAAVVLEQDSAYDASDELQARGSGESAVSLADDPDSEEHVIPERNSVYYERQTAETRYQSGLPPNRQQTDNMRSTPSSAGANVAHVAPESTTNIGGAQHNDAGASAQQLPKSKGAASTESAWENSARIRAEARLQSRSGWRIKTSRTSTASRSYSFEETKTSHSKTTSTAGFTYEPKESNRSSDAKEDTKSSHRKTTATSDSDSAYGSNENIHSAGVNASKFERAFTNSWSFPNHLITENEIDTIAVLNRASHGVNAIKDDLYGALKQMEQLNNLARRSKENLRMSEHFLAQMATSNA